MAGGIIAHSPTMIAICNVHDLACKKHATATGDSSTMATPQLLAYGNGADGRNRAAGAPIGCWISANGGKKRSWTYSLLVNECGINRPIGVDIRTRANARPSKPPQTVKNHTKVKALMILRRVSQVPALSV